MHIFCCLRFSLIYQLITPQDTVELLSDLVTTRVVTTRVVTALFTPSMETNVRNVNRMRYNVIRLPTPTVLV